LHLSSQQQLQQRYYYYYYDYDSMYNTLVARCFDGCVTNFRSKALDKAEITCVEQCAGRYIKMTQRVGIRFAEHQAMQQKRAETANAAGGGK
jgi:hypothetical protein